jgi:hypothetical protein
VTTTFRWPKALQQAIPTALSQSFGDFEYLVVGDGCEDETEDVVRSFSDSRVIWHNLEKNTGNQADVNKIALEMARGRFIAYLNHDDLWFDDHLSCLTSVLTEGALDIASTACLSISPGGYVFRGVLGLPEPAGTGVDYIPMTTTVMHTAEAAKSVGGWRSWRDVERAPTSDFFARLRRLRGAFAIVSHVTALKFHSADRPGSYALGDASEQEEWAARMRTDPNLRYKEVMRAIACERMRELRPRVPVVQPEAGSTGQLIEQWRRIRGLDPLVELAATLPAKLPPQSATYLSIRPDGHTVIHSTPGDFPRRGPN